MDPPHPPRRQHIGTLHHTGSSSSGTSSQDVKPEGRAEQAEYSQASRGSSNVQAARGVVVGRPITRTRASYSCQSCRRRKVKCDKVHPICGECSRNKEQCVYSSGPGLGIPVNTAQTHATSSTSESGGSTPAALYPSRVVDAEDGSSGVKRQRTHSGSLASVGAEISGMVASTVGAGTGSVEVKEIGSRLDRLTAMVEQLVRAQPHSASVESTSAQLTPYPTSQKSSPREQRKRGGDAMMHPDPRALEQIQLAPIERTFSAPPRMEEEDETSLEEPPGRRASGSSDLNIGHLALEGSGRSSYIGNTYWASIYDEVAELNQLLRDQTRYHNPPERFRSNAAPPLNPSGGQTTTASGSISGNPFRSQGEDIRSSSGPLQADTQKVNLLQPSDQSTSSRFYRILPEVLANLPSKRQCDVLYRAFMQGVHPIMPVIYPPDCLQEYNEFWEWHDNYDHGSVAFAKPSFFPLLYAILYGGSVTCHVEVLRTEFNESRTSLSHRLHDEVTRSLAMVSFPRTPSMYSLVAFLIVQSILMREEEPMVCSTFITLALRVAQSMGLHRDGSRFGLDSHEAEVRRRVWWHIVYLDTIIATTLGLPPLVNLDYCDTTEVTDLKDQYVGTDAGKEYERATSLEQRPPALTDDVARGAHDSMVSAGGLYNKVKFYNTTILKRIDRILLGVKPILIKDVQKIQDIYNQCRDQMITMVGRIPWNGQPEIEPYTDIDSQVQTYMGIYPPRIAGNAHEWEKLVEAQPLDNISELEIRCQQEGYFAFPAWVRIVSSLLIDKTFCVSYQPFLRTSKSQMWSVYRQRALRHCHTFMDKFILLSTVKCFHTFQWSWPGNHQPMQAAMILLVDLYRDPMSLEAPKSRSYIDKLFALSGPDGGIVRSDDGVQNQRPLREGGREAWDMLRRLRQKAWEKAGLDPDVLWTDAEQGRVGFSHPLTSGERMMKDIRQSQFPVQRPPEKQEFPHQSTELQQAGAATVTTGSMSQNQIESTSVPVATAPPRSSSMITPITMDPTLPSIPYTTHGSSREPEEFNWDEWDSVFGEYLRVGDLMDVDAQNQWPFQDDHNT